jgi:hypothetical protein
LIDVNFGSAFVAEVTGRGWCISRQASQDRACRTLAFSNANMWLKGGSV